MLTTLRTALTRAPIYIGVVVLILGFFTWSKFTGNRLLGDDNDATEKHGYGNNSNGNRSRVRFNHK